MMIYFCETQTSSKCWKVGSEVVPTCTFQISEIISGVLSLLTSISTPFQKFYFLFRSILYLISNSRLNTQVFEKPNLHEMMLHRSIFRVSVNRAFHSTSKKSLTIPFLSTLPQKAGGVVGSPNDAYVPPPPDKAHGSFHWDFERILAVAMVPLVTIPLASGGSISTVADSLLASVLLGHLYVGFQSCIIDYIPKRVYGKNFNYAMYLLTLGSVFSAIGIYKLETEENGIVGVLTNLWSSTKESSKKESKA